MPKLLSGFIAKQIGKQLGKQLLDATLIKVTAGARTTGSLAGGPNATEASYAAKGMIEHFSTFSIANSLVSGSDRKVSLLGATIAGGQVPTSTDKITIEGTTYRIINVLDRDPDAAMYVCQCRI